MSSYVHGGVRGLKRGDQILPPAQTGSASITDSTSGWLKAEADKVYRRDRVYLITDVEQARIFAACHPAEGGRTYGGSVYLVEPEGDVELDPDYLPGDGTSVTAPSAKVLRVIDRKVTRAPYLAVLGMP